MTTTAYGKPIADTYYDSTPSAQQYRRRRLEPDAIREHLLDWKSRQELGAQFAATSLIQMVEMLRPTPAEFVELVSRVMGILREVTAR